MTEGSCSTEYNTFAFTSHLCNLIRLLKSGLYLSPLLEWWFLKTICGYALHILQRLTEA